MHLFSISLLKILPISLIFFYNLLQIILFVSASKIRLRGFCTQKYVQLKKGDTPEKIQNFEKA